MRHCFALDLKDDDELIAAYERYHLKENAWPKVINSIRASHITGMEIFRSGNRLFMIMEVTDKYTEEHQAEVYAAEPKVEEWEMLMDTFQQRLPRAGPNEKWIKIKNIFSL